MSTAKNRRRGGRPSQRAALLAAAVELFARGGSRGTSLEAIAREIGVKRPAITHHFGTKQDLLREVVAITDSMDELVFSDDAMPGLDRLSRLRVWGDHLKANESLANLSKLSVVMTVEAFEDDYPAQAEFVLRQERFRTRVRRAITLGKRDGSIRTDVNARATANEVISFMQGAGVQWFLDPAGFDISGAYRNYFDRLIRDLATVNRSLPTRTMNPRRQVKRRPPPRTLSGHAERQG